MKIVNLNNQLIIATTLCYSPLFFLKENRPAQVSRWADSLRNA